MATANHSSVSSLDKSAAQQLLHDFIAAHLGVEFLGFQSGFGLTSDLILFRHPRTRSTLAVPTSVLLQSRELAQETVASKIAASERSYLRGAA